MCASKKSAAPLPKIAVRPNTAAKIMGVHVNQIHRLIASNQLPGCISPTDRLTLIPNEAIDAYRGTLPEIDPAPYLTPSKSFHPQQVAKMLDASVSTVHRWIDDGRFGEVGPGRNVTYINKRVINIRGDGIARFLKETRTIEQKKAGTKPETGRVSSIETILGSNYNFDLDP